MRLFSSSTVALAAATLLGSVSATPNPNFEISKTIVDVDRHRERLDNGEIIVRVQRTQDLFSDATSDTAATLLLERDVHLLLKIQLDADKGKINVNDASLDIAENKNAAPVTVAGIKAETYRLPHEADAPIVTAEEMQGLVDQMSVGIVGVEVRVESEPFGPSLPVAHFDEGSNLPSISALSMRKVGLWIRITEIEGKTVPHTTSIFTPILQLVVTGKGDKIEKIETLAINGKAPEEALNVPGLARVKSLPAVEGGPRRTRPFDNDGSKEPNHTPEHHHHGHHHGHHHDHHHDHDGKTSGGLLGWIARTLDLSRLSRGSQRAGRPCHGKAGKANEMAAQVIGDTQKNVKEMNAETAPGKVIGHRPMLDNPFSGMADDDEGYESGKQPENVKHHMRPHGHHRQQQGQSGPRKHGKCGNFFRRMAIGVVYGFALFGSILMHPFTAFFASTLAACALTFHVVRRIVLRKRQGQLRLRGEEDQEPLIGEKEEKDASILQEVVIEGEDLPRYEERV